MMNDEEKTKQQLLNELSTLRKEIAALKQLESNFKQKTKQCIFEYQKRFPETENLSLCTPCIFDHTGTAMFITEEDTTISLMNRECEKLTGYTKENVEGKKSWTEFIIREELERLREYHRLRRTQPDRVPKSYETRMIDQQGNVKDIFITVAMIPRTKKSIASLLDITARKAAEKALELSEEKFRSLVEQIPDTVIYVAALDESSTTLYVSPQIMQILGYSQEEYKEDPDIWAKCLHPDDKASVMAKVAQCHMTGEKFCEEYRMVRRDGQTIWFHDHAQIVKDAQGSPLFLLGINCDITTRKQTEQSLRERERELGIQTKNLEEINAALSVLLKKREADKTELEEKVLFNINQLIEPYIAKLNQSGLDERQKALAIIIESNLKEITSSFAFSLSTPHLNMTPKEIEVANLIKQGKASKEICEILGSSEKVIAFHRQNIRKKLGLLNKKVNLKSYLISKPK
jgi:PAS domain S-box-containing protein